jgi:hypothetical protein
MAIELTETSMCAFEGCEAKATDIACGRETWDHQPGRHPNPAPYCHAHAEIVSGEGYPEYGASCPNCDCWFGVN